jgi:hypothetical protein
VRTDSILLARLGLLGRFRAVDEPLFLNREHEDRSVRLVPGERAATRSRLSKWVGVGPIPPPQFWDPSLAGKITFPEWRILLEYVRSIHRAPLSAAERARCYATLAAVHAEAYAQARPRRGHRRRAGPSRPAGAAPAS